MRSKVHGFLRKESSYSGMPIYFKVSSAGKILFDCQLNSERILKSLSFIVLALDRPLVSNGLKVARLSAKDLPSLLLQRVGRFQIKGELESDYLFAFLNSSGFINEITGHDQSIGVPHISPKQVESIEIPLPSPAEQKRIVGILSDRLSTIEQARAATAAQLAAAKALPAAYLRQIFDSPEAQKWKRKKLGDIAVLERGKFSPRPRNDPKYYGGKYPWIQTGIVERSGKYITTYSNTLNEAGLQVSRLFPKGSLVITIAANIGAVGILNFDSCMPDSLVGVIPKPETADTDFLYHALLYIRSHLQSIAPQAAQANLKLSLLSPTEIPCPSLEKQRQLASTLSTKIEQSEILQKSLQSQLDTINQLPAALLRRAFNGEL
jgi:type I restriction enzyme, S subunit